MPVSTGGLDKGQVINGYAVSGDANNSEVGIMPIGGQDGTTRRELLVSALGEPQVAVSQPLPAGNNNIGDVDIASALPAGNNNIGDVDVASIAAGTNIIGKTYLTDGATDLDVVTDGGAVPTSAVAIAGTDGANSQIISVDANGRVNTNANITVLDEETDFAGAVAIVTGSYTAVNSFSPGANTTLTKICMSSTDAALWRVLFGTTGGETQQFQFQTSGSNLNFVLEWRRDITTAQTVIVQARGTKAGITADATIMYN